MNMKKESEMFDQMSEYYDKFRPDYPKRIIDMVIFDSIEKYQIAENLLRKVNRFFENNSTKFQGNGRSTKRAKKDEFFRPRDVQFYVIRDLIHGKAR